MKIKTPDGKIFDFDECELIDDDNCQKGLAEEMFEKYGILVAVLEGGENSG